MDSYVEEIEIIKRQTDYSEEVIRKKLMDYDGNIEKVIMDYIKPEAGDDVREKVITKNQTRYKEIRGMMDEAMRNYESKRSVGNE